MRIGVLADTHIFNRPLPDEVIDLMQGVDKILHAGDILDMGVLRQLEGVAETVAVKGNMDFGVIARQLPTKRVLEIEGHRIGLIHGWGPPSGITRKIEREFDDVDCIVFGHTHQGLIKWRGGILFFNPGSPTDRMFATTNTVGFLDVAREIVPEIVEVDYQ